MKPKLEMGLKIERRADWKYCEGVLPLVSRTFALNIAQLEGNTYRAVLLGYLFFRIADTFEDNVLQNETQKIEALHDYARIFKGDKALDVRLSLYESLRFRWKENSPEKNLVENGHKVIRCYFDLPQTYREIIDLHIAQTSECMAMFQRRKQYSSLKVFQLRDMPDLEAYCYCVAGVVGEMLTEIFCQHPAVGPVKLELKKYHTQFGLALQVTNIAKDYEKDVTSGWCYIPASVTERYGIDIEKLADLSVLEKKQILSEIMPSLVHYFDSTLKYITAIPETVRPIRMFCIVPFVLAYNTIQEITKMKANKLSQDQVRSILVKCDSYAISNMLLERNYLQIKSKLISWSAR